MAATGNEVVTISQLKTTIDSIDTSSSSIDAYPVGSIYMSVNSTSPATLFGGTWQRIQDRFLLCAGVTYAAGSTGGETGHKLTVNEMPAHSHGLYASDMAGISSNACRYGEYAQRTVQSKLTGGDAAHNNMPPYLAVYAWKRTA